MTFTYEQLSEMTVAELRDVAKGIEHEAVQGYTQMNKEHLLPAICNALSIDFHVHHHHHPQVKKSIDKADVKKRLRVLQTARDQALEAHDHKQLKIVRRTIHSLKRRIRTAAE